MERLKSNRASNKPLSILRTLDYFNKFRERYKQNQFLDLDIRCFGGCIGHKMWNAAIKLFCCLSSQLTQTRHCYIFRYNISRAWISKWQAYKSAVCTAQVFWCWFQLPGMQKGWGGTCKYSSNKLGGAILSATNAELKNSYYLPYVCDKIGFKFIGSKKAQPQVTMRGTWPLILHGQEHKAKYENTD